MDPNSEASTARQAKLETEINRTKRKLKHLEDLEHHMEQTKRKLNHLEEDLRAEKEGNGKKMARQPSTYEDFFNTQPEGIKIDLLYPDRQVEAFGLPSKKPTLPAQIDSMIKRLSFIADFMNSKAKWYKRLKADIDSLVTSEFEPPPTHIFTDDELRAFGELRAFIAVDEKNNLFGPACRYETTHAKLFSMLQKTKEEQT
ncbi:hypothetical protein UCRNP2_5609 [Neofusicoccum parvum UCRNP2]|uniref:Uncharacterized protein n=1 Tax=Botryosphaeria parva (strain UCR-NP2) TaxID=1287680 RepID=R1GH82_BOTPV|nr:hypothetical protein UCRNP2_5609 [Neofusicoccum parvum UCRNP2]